MELNSPLIKKRTLRAFKELICDYELGKDLITYFEDEEIHLENLDFKHLELNDCEALYESYIKALDISNPFDVKKLLSVMETFIIKNKKSGLWESENFETFIEFLQKDEIEFDGTNFRLFFNGSSLEKKETDNAFQTSFKGENELESEDGNSLAHLSEDEREVFIEPVQYSIFELHRKYGRGDLILSPFYQRESVWKIPKKSKLIESVLRKIPIPSLYFAERKDGKWEVVDGQQRLRAFFDYLEGDFKLSKLPVLTHLKGLSFNRLETIYQRKLEDYQLHIFIISKDSHPDVRFDIFERINEGATQLNAQELRNSMYREGQIEFIKELAKDKHFIALTKGKLQVVRLKDQEAVLRFLAFYINGYKNYNGNLNSFLNYTMDRYHDYYNDLNHIKHIFSQTMNTILDVFGANAFTKNDSRMINMSLFDILTYSFAKFPNSELHDNASKIVKSLNELISNDEEFYKSISHNTLSKKSVNYRFEKWIEVLEETIRGER